MTSKPRTGSRFTFDAPDALGAMHVSETRRQLRADAVDPAVEDEDFEFAEAQRGHHRQDMHPGTAVEVVGYDDDRELVLVSWTDGEGTPRITSVEPDHFSTHFTSAKG